MTLKKVSSVTGSKGNDSTSMAGPSVHPQDRPQPMKSTEHGDGDGDGDGDGVRDGVGRRRRRGYGQKRRSVQQL